MPKPYYEQDGITIYHGDCREILPSLPRASADLLLTDPPYGVSYQSNYRAERYAPIANDDGGFDVIAALGLAVPALRAYRHAYIFGRWDLSSLMFAAKTTELIWDKTKTTAGDLSIPWGVSHEPITFAVRVDANTAKAVRGGLAARLRKGSIIRCCPPEHHIANHPTEKPVLLLRQLIESSSQIGELVLDPFMGVGTTLQAAQVEGRKAIGIEIEERYCEIAARRMSQTVLDFGKTG